MSATVESLRIRVTADPDPNASYLSQDGFEERRAQYAAGTFSFVGVSVEARIKIPSGQGFILQDIRSPGLWGIEDDSGEGYFRDVAGDELETLRSMLNELCVDLPNGDELDATDAPLVYA